MERVTPFFIPTADSIFPSYWKDISNGILHTIARKNDGSLWAWGINTSGQLGNGTNVNYNLPTFIPCPNDIDGLQNNEQFENSRFSIESMFKVRFYGQDNNTLLCDTMLTLNCGVDTISTCITVKNVYAACVPNAGHYTVYATIDNISSPALIADQLIITSTDPSVGIISPVILSPTFGPSDPPRMVQFDVTTSPFPDPDGVITLNFQLRSVDGNIYCNQVIGLKVLLPTCNTSCLSCPENASSSANLIVNGDFSAGNVGFGSGYTYVGSGTVNDGNYSVRNSTNLSTTNWACTDHTTVSPMGNFLVANGPRKSNTVWSQNINIISGRNYVFCFFANNLRSVAPNTGPPMMGARIMPSGQIIITPTVVNNLPDQWMIYTGTFTATTTGSITIEIYDNQSGEFADIAIDDISILECQNSICPDNIVENGSFDDGIIPGDLGTGGLAIAWTELDRKSVV